jgi:hypothetical protein
MERRNKGNKQKEEKMAVNDPKTKRKRRNNNNKKKVGHTHVQGYRVRRRWGCRTSLYYIYRKENNTVIHVVQCQNWHTYIYSSSSIVCVFILTQWYV